MYEFAHNSITAFTETSKIWEGIHSVLHVKIIPEEKSKFQQEACILIQDGSPICMLDPNPMEDHLSTWVGW